jgi:toxin ParE1/3/4
MPIHRRNGVILDLAELYAWIGDRDLDAAERFLAAVEDTFDQIRKQPGIGWERPWKNQNLRGLRSWRVKGFPNFLVFYREEDSTIGVYAVLRGARHLERELRMR